MHLVYPFWVTQQHSTATCSVTVTCWLINTDRCVDLPRIALAKMAGRRHWKSIGCICRPWSWRYFWQHPGIVWSFLSPYEWTLQELLGVSCLTRRGYHRGLSRPLSRCIQDGNTDQILFRDLTRREIEIKRCDGQKEEVNWTKCQYFCFILQQRSVNL